MSSLLGARSGEDREAAYQRAARILPTIVGLNNRRLYMTNIYRSKMQRIENICNSPIFLDEQKIRLIKRIAQERVSVGNATESFFPASNR